MMKGWSIYFILTLFLANHYHNISSKGFILTEKLLVASLWTRPWPQKHAHENWDVKRANHTKYKPNRMSGTPSNRLLNILKNDRFKRPQTASDGLKTLFELYLYFHFSPPCKISAQLDHFWSVKTGQIQRASNGLWWPQNIVWGINDFSF